LSEKKNEGGQGATSFVLVNLSAKDSGVSL
jgi:hypothetical protein